MSSGFTNNIKQYHKRASKIPEKDDITVTAFVTENRFEDLKRLTELWQGMRSINNDSVLANQIFDFYRFTNSSNAYRNRF